MVTDALGCNHRGNPSPLVCLTMRALTEQYFLRINNANDLAVTRIVRTAFMHVKRTISPVSTISPLRSMRKATGNS